MQFLNPKILWHLIWLVPALLIIFKYAQATRSRAISLLFGPNYNAKNIYTLSIKARFFKYLLFFISILFIFLALARPSWGKKIIPITASGRDIIIVCDVSKSMLATDIAPSRLDHAKFLIKELVHQFPNDRFAIVAFAGTAFLQCPLTVDKVSFLQMLDELKPDIIPVGGTNLQTALEYALKAFGAAESSHRAIVLISDGDENYGNVDQILNELKKSNIPIFAIGIGNPLQSTPISIRDEKGNTSFLRDSQGNIATTKLNEVLLQSLATSTNGIYIRSTATNTGIELLTPRIKALIPEKFASFENTRPIERFQLPLAIAIFLLFIRLAISERKRNLAVLTAFCTCLNITLANNADLPLPEQNENINLTQSQKPKISAGKIPPHEIFNKALQLHKQNSFEDAQTLYQNAASHQSATPEIRKKSLQNLGAIFHQQGRNVLSQNPQEALKKFSIAEKLYVEALRENFPNSDLAQNQQILLNDIKIAQQIIQQQQKLQEAQQKAKEELQKAADKNNEAQQNPNNQQKSKEAQQQTQKAQEELQNYQEKLNEQQNKQEKEIQKTQTALDEIQNALNEQRKENFEKAQEHLNNALQQFKEDEKQVSAEQENKSQQQEQKENQENQSTQQAIAQPEENKEQNIDPEQAEALLQLIADDEKELREKLLKERLQNSKIKPVEKDW